VPQRPHAFHGTVRDYLGGQAPIDDAAAWGVLERAAVAAAVRAWPAGLDTALGADAALVAGGEMQRLALARALHSDAWLLLLDEPTSQLDATTEAAVIATLRESRGGRSVVCVTHRLTLAAAADLVVVMEAGRIVESGPPEALAAGGGWYSRALRAWDAVA
jgi:ABC-type multidrug transport system fused ATPase/permease subunit